uniref:Uncharacterized protein n=1 Tax=Sphaerodactylus townsendi TaxID=933632 RepID=A0ACB8EN97_9SAUR
MPHPEVEATGPEAGRVSKMATPYVTDETGSPLWKSPVTDTCFLNTVIRLRLGLCSPCLKYQVISYKGAYFIVNTYSGISAEAVCQGDIRKVAPADNSCSAAAEDSETSCLFCSNAYAVA